MVRRRLPCRVSVGREREELVRRLDAGTVLLRERFDVNGAPLYVSFPDTNASIRATANQIAPSLVTDETCLQRYVPPFGWR